LELFIFLEHRLLDFLLLIYNLQANLESSPMLAIAGGTGGVATGKLE
jgi:hypothetical protein